MVHLCAVPLAVFVVAIASSAAVAARAVGAAGGRAT